MSSQRKLNALLFELQTASSPLAQAKILARSWRTLKELSATDRRLLARHAGFEGAEQILEGLAEKKSGFAPATLLQVLNRARGTDGASVTELLAAVRDSSRREEALTRGVDLAAELLQQDDWEEESQEIDEVLEQPHTVEQEESASPKEEESVFGTDDRKNETPTAQAASGPPPRDRMASQPPEVEERSGLEKPEPSRKALTLQTDATSGDPPAVVPPAPKRVAPLPGWDRLGAAPERPQRRPESMLESKPSPHTTETSRFDALAISAAIESESSSLGRLRALDRELKNLSGAGPVTIRRILDAFPNGWVRRRALVALISTGVPASAAQALELIAALEREVDRRWCLAALAQRGDLVGKTLEKSLELVSSPAGRRRLQIIATRS